MANVRSRNPVPTRIPYMPNEQTRNYRIREQPAISDDRDPRNGLRDRKDRNPGGSRRRPAQGSSDNRRRTPAARRPVSSREQNQPIPSLVPRTREEMDAVERSAPQTDEGTVADPGVGHRQQRPRGSMERPIIRYPDRNLDPDRRAELSRQAPTRERSRPESNSLPARAHETGRPMPRRNGAGGSRRVESRGRTRPGSSGDSQNAISRDSIRTPLAAPTRSSSLRGHPTRVNGQRSGSQSNRRIQNELELSRTRSNAGGAEVIHSDIQRRPTPRPTQTDGTQNQMRRPEEPDTANGPIIRQYEHAPSIQNSRNHQDRGTVHSGVQRELLGSRGDMGQITLSRDVHGFPGGIESKEIQAERSNAHADYTDDVEISHDTRSQPSRSFSPFAGNHPHPTPSTSRAEEHDPERLSSSQYSNALNREANAVIRRFGIPATRRQTVTPRTTRPVVLPYMGRLTTPVSLAARRHQGPTRGTQVPPTRSQEELGGTVPVEQENFRHTDHGGGNNAAGRTEDLRATSAGNGALQTPVTRAELSRITDSVQTAIDLAKVETVVKRTNYSLHKNTSNSNLDDSSTRISRNFTNSKMHNGQSRDWLQFDNSSNLWGNSRIQSQFTDSSIIQKANSNNLNNAKASDSTNSTKVPLSNVQEIPAKYTDASSNSPPTQNPLLRVRLEEKQQQQLTQNAKTNANLVTTDEKDYVATQIFHMSSGTILPNPTDDFLTSTPPAYERDGGNDGVDIYHEHHHMITGPAHHRRGDIAALSGEKTTEGEPKDKYSKRPPFLTQTEDVKYQQAEGSTEPAATPDVPVIAAPELNGVSKLGNQNAIISGHQNSNHSPVVETIEREESKNTPVDKASTHWDSDMFRHTGHLHRNPPAQVDIANLDGSVNVHSSSASYWNTTPTDHLNIETLVNEHNVGASHEDSWHADTAETWRDAVRISANANDATDSDTHEEWVSYRSQDLLLGTDYNSDVDQTDFAYYSNGDYGIGIQKSNIPVNTDTSDVHVLIPVDDKIVFPYATDAPEAITTSEWSSRASIFTNTALLLNTSVASPGLSAVTPKTLENEQVSQDFHSLTYLEYATTDTDETVANSNGLALSKEPSRGWSNYRVTQPRQHVKLERSSSTTAIIPDMYLNVTISQSKPAGKDPALWYDCAHVQEDKENINALPIIRDAILAMILINLTINIISQTINNIQSDGHSRVLSQSGPVGSGVLR